MLCRLPLLPQLLTLSDGHCSSIYSNSLHLDYSLLLLSFSQAYFPSISASIRDSLSTQDSERQDLFSLSYLLRMCWCSSANFLCTSSSPSNLLLSSWAFFFSLLLISLSYSLSLFFSVIQARTLLRMASRSAWRSSVFMWWDWLESLPMELKQLGAWFSWRGGEACPKDWQLKVSKLLEDDQCWELFFLLSSIIFSSCSLQMSSWSINLLWTSISFSCRIYISSSCPQHSPQESFCPYIICSLGYIQQDNLNLYQPNLFVPLSPLQNTPKDAQWV